MVYTVHCLAVGIRLPIFRALASCSEANKAAGDWPVPARCAMTAHRAPLLDVSSPHRSTRFTGAQVDGVHANLGLSEIGICRVLASWMNSDKISGL